MLVIIAIIAILTLIVVPNYGSNGSQLALQRSANKLAQDIRRVEEMAMSAREISGSSPPYCYGIEFTSSSNSYTLFVDANNDGQRGGGEPNIEPSIILENRIIVNRLLIDGSTEKDTVWITFEPPDPTIYFDYLPTGGSAFNINIELIGNNKTKTVIVNRAGLIYVE
jgi:Tfp pilus assembly protein FimT